MCDAFGVFFHRGENVIEIFLICTVTFQLSVDCILLADKSQGYNALDERSALRDDSHPSPLNAAATTAAEEEELPLCQNMTD